MPEDLTCPHCNRTHSMWYHWKGDKYSCGWCSAINSYEKLREKTYETAGKIFEQSLFL